MPNQIWVSDVICFKLGKLCLYKSYFHITLQNFPISQREKQAQRDTGSTQAASISLCLLLSEGAG